MNGLLLVKDFTKDYGKERAFLRLNVEGIGWVHGEVWTFAVRVGNAMGEAVMVREVKPDDMKGWVIDPNDFPFAVDWHRIIAVGHSDRIPDEEEGE